MKWHEYYAFLAEYDEYVYPPEVEREMEMEWRETKQYWSNFPQWTAELHGDFIVL